ncbi:hypothetical protein AB3X91_37910 [Paraburkholderia sp. BR14263]|uniref:hypothetical protein n=1 Tax=unclassified Paraburkholderia TaxID=2615204 RepID=UPI0034CE7FA8
MTRLLTFAVSCLLASACVSARADSCDEDTLQSKDNDGTYLIMQSGAVYEVMAGDNIDSALWLPAEDVMVCSRTIVYQGRSVLVYDIINKDENEKVGAIRRR